MGTFLIGDVRAAGWMTGGAPRLRRVVRGGLWVVAVTVMACGCGRSPEKPGSASLPASGTNAGANVVAQVNGVAITRQMVQEKRRRSVRQLSAEAALEELIQAEATYQKALAAGIDRQPEVQARLRQVIIAQFRERHERGAGAASVTDAEVQLAYESRRDQFRTAGAVRGAMVFLESYRTATPEARAQLRQRAEAIWAEARGAVADADFARLVARVSDDRATRYQGGDTGWLQAGDASSDAQLVEALTRLTRPGELAPLLETPRGFYIVRLTARREPAVRPLSEVREIVRHHLLRECAEAAERQFQSALRDGLDIQVHRAVLEELSRPVPGAEPPGLPDAGDPIPTTARIP